MNNTVGSTELSAEKLKQIIKGVLGREYSTKQIKQVMELSEVMFTIASGEFECKSCKDKYRIYGIKHDC